MHLSVNDGFKRRVGSVVVAVLISACGASPEFVPDTDAGLVGEPDGQPLAPDAAIEDSCETSILYVEESGVLKLIAPDGTEKMTYPELENRGTFHWSPDGTKFLSHQSSTVRRPVWVVSADGTSVVDINNETDVLTAIAWIPGRDAIVMAVTNPAGDASVLTMDSSGLNVETLIANPNPGLEIKSVGATATHAFYVIANGTVWRIPLDGSSDVEQLVVNLGSDGALIEYSPTADRFVVQASNGPATMSPDGASLIGLSQLGNQSSFNPSWVGGQYLVVTRFDRDNPGYSFHLHRAEDGSEVLNLTPQKGAFATGIQASDPTGKSIVYMLYKEEGVEMRIIEIDGSNDRLLSFGFLPRWRPCFSNGQRLPR